MASSNNTVISLASQSIIDADGNTWTIVNGQVVVNCVVDASTANVIEMAYENGIVWQKNADNLWWGKTCPADFWEPPYGTSTDPIPDQAASANGAVVQASASEPSASLQDASGNDWSISQGQVTLNGVADPTTYDVIALAYVDGQIWQENAQYLWWGKHLPSDPWRPPYGTSDSPLAEVVRTWNGGFDSFGTAANWTPQDIPAAGQAARIDSGVVMVGAGEAAGVDFALNGGNVDFLANGSYSTGTWSCSGSPTGGYLGYYGNTVVTSGNTTITATGINVSGHNLLVLMDVDGRSSWTWLGDSSLTNGAMVTFGPLGHALWPVPAMGNDGTMTVDNSTLWTGELQGQGTVRATGGSHINVVGGQASETIQLVSAHLLLQASLYGDSTALSFMSNVTEFGADSTIELASTYADREVFAKSSPTAGELFLYNRDRVVADIRISGQAQIYAENVAPGPSPMSVLLTAYDTGHSIPFT